MQYDTIEELMLELSLYPNKKIDILEDCARECEYGWFTVAKDGNCALFDENGELDDINKVKSIDEDMIPKFIEKIIIPDGVTNIKYSAFQRCSRLMSVTIPNSVTSIGDRVFAWCNRLTSVTIPDSVTSIGDETFKYCSWLTNVTIPDSVTSIGNNTFMYCYNLKKITFKGKTLNEVKLMYNYPFGIQDESIIRCEA